MRSLSPASWVIRVVSTGNEELDSRIGGGVPHPAFIVVEGGNGTAKTTLVLQIAYGMLSSGLRVALFTTESTARHLLLQARGVRIDLVRYFVKGSLRVYSTYTVRHEPPGVLLQRLLSWAERASGFDAIAVDSLTPLAAGDSAVGRLVYVARRLVARGVSFIATVHPGVLGEPAMLELRAAADVYYSLGLASVGGKQVRVLRVVKARGAPDVVEGSVAFDVDPAFGIKIVPIVLAQS
ncbi:ATPase domain-containing protein [Pyrodictium abyssi]|uniref:ATPase domain-containing protein n=1 Tax=Pyrodictium abyssi TaxID=54256 RepID=A0ABM8IWK2_9CREN|nr:ATPase domain-containing protein [Pyrodictium abyssi]